jgi:hypothetical protein
MQQVPRALQGEFLMGRNQSGHRVALNFQEF